MTYAPAPEDRFSFGLWTVGHPGFDPFGEPTREVLSPVQLVELLAEVGAWGVNLHDNDLVPIDASAHERDQIVSDFKKALDATGLVVPMATTNLFRDPVFRDGAFTANDPRVRAFALQKTMRAIDLGVELGATTYVFWGGREGVETDSVQGSTRGARLVRRRSQLPVRIRAGAGVRPASSRSSPSRTSREPTSTCPPSARCSRSSRRSSTPRWSASTPRSRTSTWPA